MKVKAYLILVLAILLSLSGLVYVIGTSDTGIADLLGAYSNYKHAKGLNSENYVNQVVERKAELVERTEESEKLQVKYSELQNEILKLSNDGKQVEEMTSSLMYNKLVSAGLPHDVDVIKFYTYTDQYSGALSFTSTMTGKLADLNDMVQSLKENLGDWNIDVGNFSLRQNYDAYSLPRSYDTGTLLDWYDNKIVNALGEVINIGDLLKAEESEEDKEKIMYSLVSLDDVKLDEAGRDKEVVASNSYYEKLISDAISNYGKQLALIDETDYSFEVKEELRAKQELSYQKAMDDLQNQKNDAAKAIESKYQRMYENQKRQVSNALQLYKDKLDELKGMLVDSSDIEYRLDLTFSCK